MTDRYIVRYVSGFVEEVEPIESRPDNFDGAFWHVWLLDYKTGEKVPHRVSKQVINMAMVEKVQEVVQ